MIRRRPKKTEARTSHCLIRAWTERRNVLWLRAITCFVRRKTAIFKFYDHVGNDTLASYELSTIGYICLLAYLSISRFLILLRNVWITLLSRRTESYSQLVWYTFRRNPRQDIGTKNRAYRPRLTHFLSPIGKYDCTAKMSERTWQGLITTCLCIFERIGILQVGLIVRLSAAPKKYVTASITFRVELRPVVPRRHDFSENLTRALGNFSTAKVTKTKKERDSSSDS